MLERTRNSQRGVISALAAILLTALFLILSLALWLTYQVKVRAEAQAALDAAAISAAGALPLAARTGNTSYVQQLLTAFNSGTDPNHPMNSVRGDGPGIDYNTDVEFVNYQGAVPAPTVNIADPATRPRANGIRITKSYESWFSSLLGGTSASLEFTSTAVLGGTKCQVPRLPIALLDCQLPGYTVHCSLGCAPAVGYVVFGGSLHPKNSGAYFGYSTHTWGLDPANPSAVNCRDTVNQTDFDHIIPELCAGSIIKLNNGTIDNCLEDIRDKLVIMGVPWKVYAPVISCDDVEKKNNGDYVKVHNAPISGFAAINILEVVAGGSEFYIKYERVCETVPSSTGGGYACGITAELPVLIE